MKMDSNLSLSLLVAGAVAFTGCSSTTATTDTASAKPSSAASTKPPSSVQSGPRPSASVASTPSAPTPAPSVVPAKRKRPTGWKEEWQPYPEEGDNVFEFPTVNELTRKDVPDPTKCPIDGPFWEQSVSYWGGPCGEKDQIVGCAEISQRLYEAGHWECAKAYHGLLCKEAPTMTAPPPGTPKDGDYPMAGYPQCPPEKDPRLAWRDKELTDPAKKGCFLDHDAKRCMELAAKETDPLKRQRLGQLAAAWE